MEETITINGMDPSDMTPTERLAEIGMLLSLAMMRLWLKRRGACPAASQERAISREYSLGLGAQSLPPVAADRP